MRRNLIFAGLTLILWTGFAEAKSILPTRPDVLKALDRIHLSFFEGTKVDAEPLVASLQQEVTRDKTLLPAFQAAQKLTIAKNETDRLNAYSELAESLKEYIQKDESTGIHVFYCPMVKKKWIASGDKIRNPYDPSMKGCGKKI
ncbi:DUF3347 domain-containing protein [Leptospira gomenensis]|uniref:DUF3347 domain-containing protein n=1 Tax=Leptospira gomenensis TaxID=2484974 RepID=A0A5F1YHA9_9LEPT|nr:DUF3347 domain-containing protein [Leptospira gomenensis]TGK37507.1 DUF3347 domain-containing protein [Leptospira gomenensis]TGK39487.1 DUF3347 domain-containing protein [Leptospira gomenensis]TGK43091.1 DUF3347 domain-containing protein [Leptospira gomenensis]TGK55080.1 DUF3347 domain-containing protein [Leptospira gomenensis]